MTKREMMKAMAHNMFMKRTLILVIYMTMIMTLTIHFSKGVDVDVGYDEDDDTGVDKGDGHIYLEGAH